MHIGSGNKFQYNMQGRGLATVTATKDLGVHLCNDLKSAEYCYEARRMGYLC